MAEVTVFATVNPGDVVDTVEFMRKHLDDARTFLNTIPKGDYEDAYINAADIVYSLRDLDDMDKVVIIGTVASSLLVTINELSWRLADLEARTGMNSRTSSKPPSTDGYAKPNSKGVQEAQEDEDEGDLSLEDLEEEGYDGDAGEGLEEEGKDGDAGESLEEEGKDGDAGEGLEEEDEDGDAGEGLEEEDEDGDAGEGLKEEGKDGDAGEDPKEEDLKDDPNGGGEDGETDEEYRSRTNKDRSLRDLFDSEDGGTNGCGHGCVLPANATVLGSVAHWPAKCKDCPHFGECREEAFGVLTRNVLNIEVNVTVEPHVAYAILCPEEEDVLVAASFPEELKSSIQYGNYIQALVIILTCFGFVSWEKSREIIAAIMGRSFGKGCIEAFIHQLALKLTPTIELIKNALWLSKVIGADETGYRVSGKLAWVHIACNAFFTYVFISAKRGNEGMSEAGFLDFYEGILMSGCWKSYFKLDNVVNGLCNAHLLRELFGVAMFMAEDTEWASELIILLLEMNHRREQLKKEGKSEFSKEEKKEFYHRWGHIIAKGLALHPLPKDNGKKARGKVRCLLDRLVEHHKDFCLFVEDFEIPFTNNCSESGLRPVSNKSNVSYCFQSWEGARDFMIIGPTSLLVGSMIFP